MSILIHEQAGRRIIFYPDDRHLRQDAVSCPTLISVEVWPDAASAENALRDGWSLGKMIRTLLKPGRFLAALKATGLRTDEACREFGVVEDLRFIELCASYG